MASRARLQLAASTALVTGATGGLGEAISRALAARGTRLLVSGRREAELSRLAEDLGATAIVCDLAVAEDVDRLAATAVKAGVQILVANAGVPASGLLADLSQADIDRMLDVNLRAPIALARALSSPMVEGGAGHLAFVSSLQGKAAVPHSSIYSATKFGLRGFALALRQDLRSSGVGVSVVMPGFIRDAGMFAETGYKLPPGVGTKSPADVADAVIAAIEHNRAELDVAPIGLRAGAAIASVAPGLSERASRVLGSRRIAAGVAARQRGPR
jgi:short-subunit dehydrogenase